MRRKNKLTEFVEININNLAAVPSIIFGLLGLSIFIGVFGVTRSTPLVGGLVLTLMTLPTIIISGRAALNRYRRPSVKRPMAWVPRKCRWFSTMYCRWRYRAC